MSSRDALRKLHLQHLLCRNQVRVRGLVRKHVGLIDNLLKNVLQRADVLDLANVVDQVRDVVRLARQRRVREVEHGGRVRSEEGHREELNEEMRNGKAFALRKCSPEERNLRDFGARVENGCR
eukprot:1676048-Rhodomonas_salina.2